MKRTILALILLAGFIAVPAMAQDFSNPKPQFLSFSIGVPIGYSMNTEDAVAGTNFTLGFTLIDKLEVGLDRMLTSNLFRAAFSFTDMLGAAVGYGSGNSVIIGVFANFFQTRAASGIAYSLGMRIDYLATNVGVAGNFVNNGNILFTARMTFGL